jgi:hypothetical protein
MFKDLKHGPFKTEKQYRKSKWKKMDSTRKTHTKDWVKFRYLRKK